MLKNTEWRPCGGRGRQLGLIGLAAVMLAGAGAAAIYAIHRTMPSTSVGAAAVRAAPSGFSTEQGFPAGADGVRDAAAGSVQASAPGDAAGREEASAAHTGAPAPALTSKVAPPVSLRPLEASEAIDAQEAATPEQPAAEQLVAKPPRGKRRTPTEASTPTPIGQGAEAPHDRFQRGRAKDQTEPAVAERLPDQGAPDGGSLPARPSRLADAQQASCGEEGMLSRLICNERVRLRFCRDRWNGHADCMVEAPRNDF